MNTISATVLNAHVANETKKRVTGGFHDGYVENKHDRERDRDDMWLTFMVGMFFGMFYAFCPASKCEFPLVGDCILLFLYVISTLAISSVSLNEKQPRSAVMTSLIMAVILPVVMLIPFIMDMDTQVHFRICTGGIAFNNGPMYYSYYEYDDYTNIFQIGIMVVIFLVHIVTSIRGLYKFFSKK